MKFVGINKRDSFLDNFVKHYKNSANLKILSFINFFFQESVWNKIDRGSPHAIYSILMSHPIESHHFMRRLMKLSKMKNGKDYPSAQRKLLLS